MWFYTGDTILNFNLKPMWLLKTSTVFRGCLKVLICWTYSINFESIKYLLSTEFYRQWFLQAVLFLNFLNFKIARIVWASVYEQLSTNLKYKLSSQWGESVGLPCMKEIYRISKFTKLESSTFAKGFFVCMRPIFCYSGIIFTLLNFFRFQTNLKIYSGKPDWYGKTRVTIYELRAPSYELRVTSYELKA